MLTNTITPDNARPTLLVFYKPGCERCDKDSATMALVRERVGDKAILKFIDGTTDQDAMRQYKVATYPTFILFKDGQEVWRDAGEKSADELVDMINRFV